MKNNIKKAPVKFREDRLYFQHFYADFCLCPKSVIITTLRGMLLYGVSYTCSPYIAFDFKSVFFCEVTYIKIVVVCICIIPFEVCQVNS